MITLGLNLLMTLYLGHFKPYMYRIELMNEMFVAASSYHLVLFSEWVPTEDQDFYGRTFVGTLCVLILANMCLVISNGLPVHLLLKRFYNRHIKTKFKEVEQVEPQVEIEMENNVINLEPVYINLPEVLET